VRWRVRIRPGHDSTNRKSAGTVVRLACMVTAARAPDAVGDWLGDAVLAGGDGDAVALALDADSAGIQAALRGEQIVREMDAEDRGEVTIDVTSDWRNIIRVQSRAPVDVRIFSVPSGKDPDEAIRAEPSAWPQWVRSALPPFEFRLQVELTRLDRSNPRARLDLLNARADARIARIRLAHALGRDAR